MPEISLESLIESAAKLADVIIDERRYSASVCRTWANTALGKYHSLLTEYGGEPQRATLVQLTTSASTTVADGYPTNERVVLPADFGELREVAIRFGTTRRPIRPFGGIDAGLGSEEYWSTESITPGIPERYAVARAADGETVLRLMPPCDGVYTIDVMYVPTLTALDADADTYQFLDGTEDFVVCDIALKLLETDGVQESSQYSAIRSRRDEAGTLLVRKASRLNRAGPRAMIDVRGRTRRARGGYLA